MKIKAVNGKEIDFTGYIDLDGFPSPYLNGGSQNGYYYCGLLSAISFGAFEMGSVVGSAFAKFGYFRGSHTHDIVSFDDLTTMVYVLNTVKHDLKANHMMHPRRPNNKLQWFLGRNLAFTSLVYPNLFFKFFRHAANYTTGIIKEGSKTCNFVNTVGRLFGIENLVHVLQEGGSSPFLMAYTVGELYGAPEFVKRKLYANAYNRWPDGMLGAFKEYFGATHPIVALAAINLKSQGAIA